MAPRGGGKGGSSSSSGGGSRGGSRSSGSRTSSSGASAEEFDLYGSNFQDPVIVAAIVFYCLAFSMLFLTAIALRVVNQRADPPRKLYRWYWLGIVLYLTMIVFILDIVDLFLAEMIGSAQGGYFVTYIIGEAVGHTASVWLLLLMYTMLNQLFSRYSWKPATRGTVMNWVHWAVCGVLAIISVAVIVCSARYQVQRIRDGPSPSVLVATRQWGLYEAWTRVRTVYDAVYLAASLELLALAVYKYFRSRKLGSSDQIIGYFLWFVAVPNCLRSLAGFALRVRLWYFTITKTTQVYPIAEVRGITLALTILQVLPTAIVFAGLVYIGLRPYDTAPGAACPNEPKMVAAGAETEQKHHSHISYAEVPRSEAMSDSQADTQAPPQWSPANEYGYDGRPAQPNPVQATPPAQPVYELQTSRQT